jgi:hypothetical protein
MEDSRIKQVSQLLGTYFDKKTLAAAKDYVGFLDSWPMIAGQRLSDHSRPVDIRHGMLIIETDHSGWIQLIRLEQERILREISRRFPELEVTAMSIRIGNEEKRFPGEESIAGNETRHGLDAAPTEDISPVETTSSQNSVPEWAEMDDTEEGAGKRRTRFSEIPPELKDMFDRIKKNITSSQKSK